MNGFRSQTKAYYTARLYQSWFETNFVRNIQIGFSSTELHDHRHVAVLAGDVKGCVAVAILVVHIAVMAEQTLHHFNLTSPHCQMQSDVTILKYIHANTMIRIISNYFNQLILNI